MRGPIPLSPPQGGASSAASLGGLGEPIDGTGEKVERIGSGGTGESIGGLGEPIGGVGDNVHR